MSELRPTKNNDLLFFDTTLLVCLLTFKHFDYIDWKNVMVLI